MRRKYIATIWLLRSPYKLYAIRGDRHSGSFRSNPNEICVGIDANLDDVVATFIHELYESTAAMLLHRYNPTNEISSSVDLYEFHFTHKDHAEMCAWVGTALVQGYAALEKEWKIRQKELAKGEK